MEINGIDNFREGFPREHVLEGTRLTPDALVENVEAFMELRGMSEPEAVQAKLEQFPASRR